MTAEVAPADSYFPGYGDRAYSVEHYELGLDYSLEANRLTARAVIEAVALTDLDLIRLDLHELKVTKVSVEGYRVTKFSQARGKLLVRTATPIPEGQRFRLRIGYGGRPRPVPDGGDDMGWEELADGVIVAGQTHGAPSWFPCNDRPDDKASYRIKITVPNSYYAVANGSLVGRHRGAGASTWEYDQPEPMAAYLATVHIGRYVERRLDASVPMTVVVPEARLAGVHRRLRAAGRDADAVRAALRSLPVRRVHRRRHRRRAGDPARGPGPVGVRLELPHRRLGQRAAGRPRAVPPVVRQQPDRRRVARHLAARGLRLLLRVAVVRGVRGTDRRRSAPASTGTVWRVCRRTCCWAIPVRTTCSTTASTSGAHCCCTRSVAPSATSRSSGC